MVCSAVSMPSMNRASRSSSLRPRPISSANLRLVPATKRREIAARAVALGSSLPIGSRPAW
jgi:hypothetical protein